MKVKVAASAAKKTAAAKSALAREVAAMFGRCAPKRWLFVEKWGPNGYAYGS